MEANARGEILMRFRLAFEDDGQSLEEMIDAGDYDEVKKEIYSVIFYRSRRRKRELDLTVIQFAQPLAPGEIEALMALRNSRPAFIEELLALGKAEPDLQRKMPIAALGSGVLLEGRRHVVVLGGSESIRCLTLAVIYRKWSRQYRYLFVNTEG